MRRTPPPKLVDPTTPLPASSRLTSAPSSSNTASPLAANVTVRAGTGTVKKAQQPRDANTGQFRSALPQSAPEFNVEPTSLGAQPQQEQELSSRFQSLDTGYIQEQEALESAYGPSVFESLYDPAPRRQSVEVLAAPEEPEEQAPQETRSVSLREYQELVLGALKRVESNQNDLTLRVERIESRASQRSSAKAIDDGIAAERQQGEASYRQRASLPTQDARKLPSGNLPARQVEPTQKNTPSWYAQAPKPTGNIRQHQMASNPNEPTAPAQGPSILRKPQPYRVAQNQSYAQANTRYYTDPTVNPETFVDSDPTGANQITYGVDPFQQDGNYTLGNHGGNDDNGNGNGNGPRYSIPYSQDSGNNRHNREPSAMTNYPNYNAPRLRPQDIGYWDPRGKVREDHKDRPMQISVELFIRRLHRLAIRHGPQAVVDNIESALVHVSSWLGTFSDQDLDRCLTLDGWIFMLRRDWREPEVISRRKAVDYDYTDAEDSTDYWTEKLALLRSAGYRQERDICYEMWSGLPKRWKETIDYEISLDAMKHALRQKEAAIGHWPGKSSASNRSSDSGYNSSTKERPAREKSNKRGGGNTVSFSSRNVDRSKKPKYACQICKKLGKPEEMHWHDECPNAEKKLNAIVEDEGEGAISDEEKVSESSDEDVTENISHVYSSTTIAAVKSDTFKPKTFPEPKIFHSSRNEEIGEFGAGNIFKSGSAVNIYVRCSPKSEDIRVCCDSGCGPTIGNRTFVLSKFPGATIQKRDDDVTLKVQAGFQKREYEVLPDYVSVPIYMVTNHGNLLELLVEIHLCDSDVEAGILIGATALKYNRVLLDFDKEVIIAVDATPNKGRIQVPMYFNERHTKVDGVPVKSKKEMVIPPGHEGLVPVDLSKLPDRDVLFKGKEWFDRHGIWAKAPAGVANRSCSRLVVANFGDKDFTIKKGEVIGYVSDSSKTESIQNCFNLNTGREYLDEPGEQIPNPFA